MRSRLLFALGVLPLALLAGPVSAVTPPGRTQARQGPIVALDTSDRAIAFAVGAARGDCDHVELWDTATKGIWRFGKKRPCGDATSTGSGISAVSIVGHRAAWLSYTGGNIREWSLWTATTARRTPRRLRFVARDVDAPPPIVLAEGLLYAVDRQLVAVDSGGVAAFRWTAPAPIAALTHGFGPGRIEYAVLLRTGDVVLLDGEGAVLSTLPFDPGEVKALRLAPRGLIVQVGGQVQVRRLASSTSVPLPAGARLLDYAEGRILYLLKGDIRARSVGTGQDSLLIRRTSGTPTLAAYDNWGLAWSVGRKVNWACAVCVRY